MYFVEVRFAIFWDIKTVMSAQSYGHKDRNLYYKLHSVVLKLQTSQMVASFYVTLLMSDRIYMTLGCKPLMLLCCWADIIVEVCFFSILIVFRQQLLEQAMEKDGLTEEQVCLLFYYSKL